MNERLLSSPLPFSGQEKKLNDHFLGKRKSYTRKWFEQLTGRMSIWNWCLSCCGWRPSKASTSAGSPWDRSETVTVNKDFYIKKECKERSRTPPPSASKEVGKLKKGTWKKWGQESMRGEPNWHLDTLNRPDGGQGSRGQKHLYESASVGADCVLFQVCLFVCF